MNKRHSKYSVLAVMNGSECSIIINIRRLEVQKAHDDLQVIFDAMMDLLKQPFFFGKEML
jgi:hypothetical protein